MTQLIGVKEAARRSGLSEQMIYRLRRNGVLTAYQPGGTGGRLLFDPAEFDREIRATRAGRAAWQGRPVGDAAWIEAMPPPRRKDRR